MNRSPHRRTLRVVELLDSAAATGGGERMAVTLTMGLDPARFDRTLCTTRSVEVATFDDDLRSAGVRLISLERRSKADLSAWRPLVSFIRRERVDIIHAHKFGSNIWGTILGRLTGVPVVIAHEQSWASARNSLAGPPIRRFLDRDVIGRGADVFLAVSLADRHRMIEVEGVDPAKVRVLYNAVPTSSPLAGRDVRAELGIAPGVPVIGTVCQLRPEKALDLLIASASLLRADFPQLIVLIAGEGPEEALLREQIRELGLDECVKLLGTRSDVPDLLSALDVAVCCSDFEGTPLSVMEYMAAGKPVVATRVGGLPELVDHGVHGLLFEARDADGLARAIAELLRDPSRRAAMGARGRARQRREFHIDVAVRQLEQLYEGLYFHTERARRECWAPSWNGAGMS